MPTSLTVRGQKKPLHGSVPVPSDRAITHRALILAALSNGPSEIRGFGYGRDNLATLAALRALGVRCDDDERGTLRVRGKGLEGLSPPAGALDAGSSTTCLSLLLGLLAGQPFASRIGGSPAREEGALTPVIAPLVARGARIEGRRDPARGGEEVAPFDLQGRDPKERLSPIEYGLSGPNDQAKGALLLSGLFASGPTTVFEPLVSRDHTERLLSALGMPVRAAGSLVSLHPPADPLSIPGFELDVPGDLSAAAFVLVAGQIVPGSAVDTRRTGLNPTRSAVLEVLRLCGGGMGISPSGTSLGEPWGEVSSRAGNLRGIALGGELGARSTEELAALSALFARARGVSEFDLGGEPSAEVRARLQALVALLRAFGVPADERPHGFVLEGRPEGPLRAARISSGGDHRIAMAATLLALTAEGECVIDDADCIALCYPRFVGTLRALGAEIEVSS